MISQFLFESGRCTSYTEGEYVGVRTALVMKIVVNDEIQAMPTWEHAVMGKLGAPFSRPGDVIF